MIKHSDAFKEILRKVYTPKNILLQIGFCLVTYCIVVSGFDWSYYVMSQTSPYASFLRPGIAIGGLVPLVSMIGFFAYSLSTKKLQHKLLSRVVTYSAFLGWSISSLYKAFTGRVQPPHFVEGLMVDTSRDWNFGFLEHGIFWGWPSSHTTVAFSMAFAIISFFPKQRVLALVVCVYALYIGLSVSMRIHWFSEFFAGAVLGIIIGTAVGSTLYTYKK